VQQHLDIWSSSFIWTGNLHRTPRLYLHQDLASSGEDSLKNYVFVEQIKTSERQNFQAESSYDYFFHFRDNIAVAMLTLCLSFAWKTKTKINSHQEVTNQSSGSQTIKRSYSAFEHESLFSLHDRCTHYFKCLMQALYHHLRLRLRLMQLVHVT
jgi:hypothetical protein